MLIGYVNVRCLKGRKVCPSSIISRPSSIARAFSGFEGRLVACFSYGSPRFCVRVYVCMCVCASQFLSSSALVLGLRVCLCVLVCAFVRVCVARVLIILR